MTEQTPPTEYPVPVVSRSITDGIPIGDHPDGTLHLKVIGGCFTYLFGKRGSGKSTLLRSIVLGATACADTVTWVIDLSGGTFATPFLHGFRIGDAPEPVIDWVATTLDEASRMLEAARDLAAERHHLLVERGPTLPGDTDKEPPFLFIAVADGMPELVRNPHLVRILTELADTDAAVNIGGVLTGMDATERHIPAELMPLIGTRIAVCPTTHDGDLIRAFGPNRELPVCERRGPHLAGEPGGPVNKFRAWLTPPQTLTTFEAHTSRNRPHLESGDTTDSPLYRNRWKRTAHQVFRDHVPHIAEYGQTTLTTLAGIPAHTLERLLYRSPTALSGDRGHAAVELLVRTAGSTLLTGDDFRGAFTLDNGQVFIDWAYLARAGRSLLGDRTWMGVKPMHPDIGYALVLAAGMATNQITDTGMDILHDALAYALPASD